MFKYVCNPQIRILIFITGNGEIPSKWQILHLLHVKNKGAFRSLIPL